MNNERHNSPIKETVYIKWEPPSANFYKLYYIYGSCFGNSGKGGFGGIFIDSIKAWILVFDERNMLLISTWKP